MTIWKAIWKNPARREISQVHVCDYNTCSFNPVIWPVFATIWPCSSSYSIRYSSQLMSWSMRRLRYLSHSFLKNVAFFIVADIYRLPCLKTFWSWVGLVFTCSLWYCFYCTVAIGYALCWWFLKQVLWWTLLDKFNLLHIQY